MIKPKKINPIGQLEFEPFGAHESAGGVIIILFQNRFFFRLSNKMVNLNLFLSFLKLCVKPVFARRF